MRTHPFVFLLLPELPRPLHLFPTLTRSCSCWSQNSLALSISSPHSPVRVPAAPRTPSPSLPHTHPFVFLLLPELPGPLHLFPTLTRSCSCCSQNSLALSISSPHSPVRVPAAPRTPSPSPSLPHTHPFVFLLLPELPGPLHLFPTLTRSCSCCSQNSLALSISSPHCCSSMGISSRCFALSKKST